MDVTSYTWNGVSGDWNLASNWDPEGGPPTASDSATIKGSATTTIAVDSADVAKSLKLSDANATIDDDGSNTSLTIGGRFSLKAGTFNVDITDTDSGLLTVGSLNLSGGTLSIFGGSDQGLPVAQLNLNGTMSQTGGALNLQGGTISGGTLKITGGTQEWDGTLSGVTIDGPFNLTSSVSNAYVTFTNGTKVVGSNGSGPAIINLTGLEANISFENNEIIRNETINIGTTNVNSYYPDSLVVDNGALTLASSATINAAGSASEIGIGLAAVDSYGNLINDGIIDQTEGLLELTSDTGDVINCGEIDQAYGSNLNICDVVGTTTFENNNTLIEDGEMEVGQNVNPYDVSSTKVVNESTGTWEINNAYISYPEDGDSDTIINHGLLETIGTNAFSSIEIPMTNVATILISSGTVEFNEVVNGKGTITISNGSTLEVGAVSSPKTRGSQDIDFSTGGGLLDLTLPYLFYGEISNFSTGDTVELQNEPYSNGWSFKGISESDGVTTLTLHTHISTDGERKEITHSFEFVGDYSKSNFDIVKENNLNLTLINYKT
jgi:fibronectin-binding autotransporter adhesin